MDGVLGHLDPTFLPTMSRCNHMMVQFQDGRQETSEGNQGIRRLGVIGNRQVETNLAHGQSAVPSGD